MKKMLAAVLALFLLLRISPAFSAFWAEWISLPLLGCLARAGEGASFALLECFIPLICAALLLCLPAGCFRKAFLFLFTVMFTLCTILWYPLYFLPQPSYTASDGQLAAACSTLIDELNASSLSFRIQDELPAKAVHFPGWMEFLGIDGICSFLTGEALVSPNLPAASLPFVAVHERMHLQGHASEGAACIAAWHECMARGGAYADSARLWALRSGMGLLRQNDHALYEETFLKMNHRLLQIYREAGGAYIPAPPPAFLLRACRALGIEIAVQDYENLILCLAAEWAE